MEGWRGEESRGEDRREGVVGVLRRGEERKGGEERRRGYRRGEERRGEEGKGEESHRVNTETPMAPGPTEAQRGVDMYARERKREGGSQETQTETDL